MFAQAVFNASPIVNPLRLTNCQAIVITSLKNFFVLIIVRITLIAIFALLID